MQLLVFALSVNELNVHPFMSLYLSEEILTFTDSNEEIRYALKTGILEFKQTWLLSMELSQPWPRPLTLPPLPEIQEQHVCSGTAFLTL